MEKQILIIPSKETEEITEVIPKSRVPKRHFKNISISNMKIKRCNTLFYSHGRNYSKRSK